MSYFAYLLCLALLLPAFGMTVFLLIITLVAAGPRDGWSVLIGFLAFFGAGIAEPLRYGWRIVALLAVTGLVLSAGAFASLRVPAFYALAVFGTLCILFCLYVASQQDTQNVINASIILIPSFAGIAACLWFAAKFRT